MSTARIRISYPSHSSKSPCILQPRLHVQMPQVTEINGGGDLTQTSPFPLTTVFTPDSDCVAPSAYDLTTIDDDPALQLDADVNRESCYPSGY